MMPKSQLNYIKSLIKTTIRKDNQKIPQEELIFLFEIVSGEIDKNAPRDKFGRILAKNSQLSRLNIAHRPIFNLMVKKINPDLNLWPNQKKWAVALSHDVDRVEKYCVTPIRYFQNFSNFNLYNKINYFLRMARGGVQKLQDKADYWNFPYIIDLEKKFGFRSTFFFGGTNFWQTQCPFDFFYNISEPKFIKLFKILEEESFEIGLHTSFNCFLSQKNYLREKRTLEKYAKTKISGVRSHYWRINWSDHQETFSLMKGAGINYDSSLGWNDRPGFPRSIALPFHPWKIKGDFLEIPTSMMDEAVMRQRSPLKSALSQLKAVKDINGLAVLDWHNHVFQNKDFPGWEKLYIQILNRLVHDETVYVATLGEIYNWWQSRQNDQK